MSTLTIKRVWRDTQGSPLASAVSIGATEIVVEEVVDFDEAGGTVVIDSETVTYAPPAGSDSAIDEDTNTVYVSALTAAHSKGAFVQEGAEARGPKYADGYLDDQTSVTESVFIPSHLRRLFPLGGREADDMEVVPVALDDDGSLYIVDGPPDEELAVDPVVFTWSATGNVSVGTKVHRFPVPFGGTIEEVKMVMGTGGAPSGSSIIVDILKGGASILGTKVVIPAGELGSDPVEPITKEVNKGNILQIEFEQVGSTTPGSNPTLYVTMFPSENAIARRIEVDGPAGATGANGSDGLISEVRDEGVAVTDAPVLDFTGSGVTVTSNGSVITAAISGGGSTAADALYHRHGGTTPFERLYPLNAGRFIDTFTTRALTADFLFAYPFISPRGGALAKFGLEVVTASASGTKLRFGIYAATGSGNIYPDALVLDCGEQAADSVGLKLATISQSLQPNTLYWAGVISSAAPTLRAFAIQYALPVMGIDPAAITTQAARLFIARTYGALPLTFPSGATIAGDPTPVMFGRYS